MKSSIFMLQVLNGVTRPRLLPCLITLSCLVLTVRLNVLWNHVTTPGFIVENSQAIVEVGQSAEASSQPASPTPQPQAEPEKKPAEEHTPKEEPLAQKTTFDPLLLSEQDVKLLMELNKRRADLEEREKKIRDKEVLVEAAQQQLENKTKELSTLKTDLQKILGTIDSKTKENIKQLVGVYEKMKPKDAAKFFNKLDMDILMELIQAMDGKKSSAILAAMDVDKVKTLTMNLADAQKVLDDKAKQ